MHRRGRGERLLANESRGVTYFGEAAGLLGLGLGMWRAAGIQKGGITDEGDEGMSDIAPHPDAPGPTSREMRGNYPTLALCVPG